MRDGDIDNILNAAAEGSPVDAALVERLAQSLGASARPVRPLPGRRAIWTALFVVCAAVGCLSAALLGIHGLPKMNTGQALSIFGALCGLISLAAVACVEQMTPGGRRHFPAGWSIAGGCVLLAGLFSAAFDDREVANFVQAGLVCLKAGVAVAIPAAVGGWLLVRRGYFVTPVAAGAAVGTLAGLAGITMLELHCPNFEVLHVMVWHTAVLPASALLGALAARFRVTGSKASRRSS